VGHAGVITIASVTKRYEPAAPCVLDQVTLQVDPGEFLVVMGPSGSGKSTLLNVIAGLDRPSSGRITVGGVDLSTLDESGLARLRRDRLGFIFQFFHLLPDLTVWDNILLPARLAGKRAEARATDLLRRLDITQIAGQLPGRLSGGERQRVAIARALINQPTVLLADEPTGALDSRTGAQVFDLLTELNQDGQTILMVTHDARLANRHARRVIRLADGRVVAEARPQNGLMFTDMVSSTPLLEAIGDDAWHDLSALVDGTVRETVAQYGGREITHSGDGFFVLFPSAVEAIDCGVDIQRRLHDHRRQHGFVPPLRIGVHIGAVESSGGTVRGAAVHRAARICALAAGGEIVASSEALEGSGRKGADLRAVSLKGVPDEVLVGTVLWKP
jgi:putative ABC transport system ATP-binding protein